MFVRFRTDSSVVKSGFAAEWSSACGHRVQATGEPGETGLIISPNYPALYPSDYDCSWTMTGTEETDFVRLHWLVFNLEAASSTGTCAWDKVQVYIV